MRRKRRPRFFRISAFRVLNEKLFAQDLEHMMYAFGLRAQDLWEFRAHAIRLDSSPSSLFIWLVHHPEEARKYVSLEDEDVARQYWKEHEADSGFA